MNSLKILKNNSFFHIFIIFVISVIGWYLALNGWFLHSLEPSLLMDFPWTLLSLIRYHSILYFVSFKLFGWNAYGWYIIALLLHIISSFLLYFFAYILTKKKVISFIIALTFVVNVSYLDIVVWGSYNSLYAGILSLTLASLIFIYYFRTTKKIIFYIGLLLLLVVSLLLREIAMMILFLLFFLDIIFLKKFKRNGIMELIKFYLPFVFIICLYWIFRHFNGGYPLDYVDERHRLRLSLIASHDYWGYLFQSTLGFLKKLPPLLIPWPFLNTLRDALSLPQEFKMSYFFPILGSLMMIASAWIIFLFRRDTLFRTLLFFFIFMCIGNGFFSLAMPETTTTLQQAYGWQGRYHYFSFVGFNSFFWLFLFLLWKRFKTKKIRFVNQAFFISLLIVLWTGFQIKLIWNQTQEVNRTNYAPAKNFQKQMSRIFSHNTPIYFYVYPSTYLIGDFIGGWNYLRSTSPETLIPGYKWSIGVMSLAMQKVVNGIWTKKYTYFITDTPNGKILDKTNEVNAMLSQLDGKEFTSINGTSIEPLSLPIEVPYTVELKIKAESQKVNYDNIFSKYLLYRYNYLKTVKVKVSSSRTFNGVDLFPDVTGDNLIDGNLGEYSSWVSNDNINQKSTILLDLGESKNIAAVAWSSQDKRSIPTVYKIYVSDDGKNWKIVKNVIGNTSTSPIDKFNTPVKGRFVKVDIYSTSQGDPPNVDELEVVTSDGMSILSSYTNFHLLLQDAFAFSQKNESSPVIIGQALVTTKSPTMETTIPIWFSLPVDAEFHDFSLRINDSERGSRPGEFLKRNIVKVELTLPSNQKIIVSDFKIRPTELLHKYLQRN